MTGNPSSTARDKQAAVEDVASKEAQRNAYLLQLRNELLADMSSDSDDDQPTTSFRNPFTQKKAEPQPRAPEPHPVTKAKGLEEALATRHDVQQAADHDEEPDGLLSEAELVLLGRVRRLVETCGSKPKKNTTVRPEIVPPENPPSVFPSRDTVTRRVGEVRGSDVNPSTRPFKPYDNDCRRRRRHPNGQQMQSQAVQKRRSIPGRYSALDTEEEEEWFQKHDKEQAMRKAQEAQGANGMSYRLVPNYIPPPQMTMRLFHPKLDEVIAWTSSADPTEHRANALTSQYDRCDVPKTGPLDGDQNAATPSLAQWERAIELHRSQQQQLQLHQQQIQDLQAEIEHLKQTLRQLQL